MNQRVNPYEPPQVDVIAIPAELVGDRSHALRRLRQAMMILIAPAWLNYLLFHIAYADANERLGGLFVRDPYDFYFFPVTNLIGIASLVAAIWFAGLKVLDTVALVLYGMFAGPIPRERWLSSMYDSMWTLRWAAPLGAAVWIVWLILFYASPSPVIVINNVCGILGHLVAGWAYLTIFYNWYLLRKQAPLLGENSS